MNAIDIETFQLIREYAGARKGTPDYDLARNLIKVWNEGQEARNSATVSTVKVRHIIGEKWRKPPRITLL